MGTLDPRSNPVDYEVVIEHRRKDDGTMRGKFPSVPVTKQMAISSSYEQKWPIQVLRTAIAVNSISMAWGFNTK